MTYKSFRLIANVCACSVLAALISGCSSNFTSDPITDSSTGARTPIGSISGTVHGGQAPVSGANIYMFETGTGGVGTASTSLITTTAPLPTGVAVDANGRGYITSDANGNFGFATGDYTCTPGRLVYMVATGGNSGFSQANPYIAQMLPLGICPSSGNLAAQDPYVVINEVTTVVFAYTMAPFAKDEWDIASDGTTAGNAAIQSAMTNAMNIVNIAYGQVPSTTMAGGSTGTLPVNKIYALADLLAYCVNSTGQLKTNNGQGNNGNPQPCYYLFNYTGASFTGSGKNTATTSDESQAIFYIAKNPTNANVTNLYLLISNSTAFPQNLPSPTDWTLSINYSGVVGKPGNIAFDSYGNAWVSDQSSTAGGVAKITPTGVVSKFTNLNNGGSNGSISALAVNTDDTIWALDSSNSQIYQLSYTGAWQNTFTGNDLSNPIAISFTRYGTGMVLNGSSGYISKFSSSGVAQTPATYNQSGNEGYGSLGAPAAIGVDAGGNAFIPENVGCQCMGVLANGSNTTFAYYDYSNTVGNAAAIAIDSLNNPWHAQPSNNEIVEDPSASTPLANGGYSDYNDVAILGSFTGYYFNVDVTDNYFLGFVISFNENATPVTTATGGGLNKPVSLAFDGKGQLWAANSGAATVSGFNGTAALTANGFQTGGSGTAYSVAPDNAGNLWTVNSDGSVTEILGLASPTLLPVYPTQVGMTP